MKDKIYKPVPVKVAGQFELMDYITLAAIIKCDKCKIEKKITVDDDLHAMDYFWTLGWRIVRKKCLCPNCYLLKKK